MPPKRFNPAYEPDFGERVVRHLRLYTRRSLLTALSTVALYAGIQSATPAAPHPLLAYVIATVVLFVVILVLWGMKDVRFRLWPLTFAVRHRISRDADGVPSYGHLRGMGSRAPVAQVAVGRSVDHVYESGFRALLDADSDPIAIIPSNPRDVSRPHELPFAMFTSRRGSDVTSVDLKHFGIPLSRYTFRRDLPDHVLDTDHTLAVKDLVYLPELATAFDTTGAVHTTTPFVWPEHCVDPTLLAAHDLIVIGGPDTNFWHAALFEPVARVFAVPPSTIPLALSLRGDDGSVPRYSSRSLHVRLTGLQTTFPEARDDTVELDERLYPACAMILACRNPFAPRTRPRWCVFVAGTRSLGTCGAVLALSAVVKQLRDDPQLRYVSAVPTESPEVNGYVSALLCRTAEVEHAPLALDALVPRGRRSLPLGPDVHYSDTYIPTSVQFLSTSGDGAPYWQPLVELRPPGNH